MKLGWSYGGGVIPTGGNSDEYRFKTTLTAALNVNINCSFCGHVRGSNIDPPRLRQHSHILVPSRLTNGKDSRGTGPNTAANYANKWRSPAVMAGVI